MTVNANMHPVRHLVLVLGDQLDLEAAAFDGFDAAQDAVWMAEAYEECTHIWSSKQHKRFARREGRLPTTGSTTPARRLTFEVLELNCGLILCSFCLSAL
jgi:hypothetical protein